MLIKDIGLQFSFIVMSLSDFGIRVRLIFIFIQYVWNASLLDFWGESQGRY